MLHHPIRSLSRTRSLEVSVPFWSAYPCACAELSFVAKRKRNKFTKRLKIPMPSLVWCCIRVWSRCFVAFVAAFLWSRPAFPGGSEEALLLQQLLVLSFPADLIGFLRERVGKPSVVRLGFCPFAFSLSLSLSLSGILSAVSFLFLLEFGCEFSCSWRHLRWCYGVVCWSERLFLLRSSRTFCLGAFVVANCEAMSMKPLLVLH